MDLGEGTEVSTMAPEDAVYYLCLPSVVDTRVREGALRERCSVALANPVHT
jgi:hypothetical protein